MMKPLRYLVPVLGFLALVALFLMLPEAPSIGCKSCSAKDPYLPLIGAGYFSGLIALSLLFPTFPGGFVARAGLTWAVLLAVVLTYIHLPSWCVLCLIGHACNILIWVIWMRVPAVKNSQPTSIRKERLCLILFIPFTVVALFSCLNLTFMAYGFKAHRNILGTSLRLGDKVPHFSARTMHGRPITSMEASQAGGIIINFVSPDCPHCKEQLQVLNTVVDQLAGNSYRFINVSSALPPELLHYSPSAEWVEDKEGSLRKLFKVSGYPTLFMVGANGKVAQVIPGVPEQLEVNIMTNRIRSKY